MWVLCQMCLLWIHLLPLSWDRESGSLHWTAMLDCMLKISWRSDGCVKLYKANMDFLFLGSLSSHFTFSPETISKSDVGTIFHPVAWPHSFELFFTLWKENYKQKVYTNSMHDLTNKVNNCVTTTQAKKEHCQHSKVSCRSLKKYIA